MVDNRHDRFVYTRKLGDEEFLVDCNLGEDEHSARHMNYNWTLVFPDTLGNTVLSPYEARIWKRR